MLFNIIYKYNFVLIEEVKRKLWKDNARGTVK